MTRLKGSIGCWFINGAREMYDFFQSQLDYVYFFYGLSFIILAVLVHAYGRVDKTNITTWNCLALFGLIHGIQEWFELLFTCFLKGMLPSLIQLALLVGSFVFLFEFGCRSVFGWTRSSKGRLVYILQAFLLGWFGYRFSLLGINVASRYFLAFPGCVIAGIAFLHRFKIEDGKKIWFGGAIVFFLYALLTGVIVNKILLFPANVLNVDVFFSFVGIPVQLLRGVLALLLAVFFWRAYASIWQEHSVQHAVRIIKGKFKYTIVIGSLLIFIIGWISTEFIGRGARQKKCFFFGNLAKSVTSLLHPKDVQVASERLDESSSQYMRIREFCQHVNDSISGVKYVYIMTKKKGKIIFVVETVSKHYVKDEDVSVAEAGEQYKDASLKTVEVFENGEPFIQGPYFDRWGEWVSAMVPITLPGSEKVIAILGMDIDSKIWQSDINRQRLIPILLMVVIMLIIIGYVSQELKSLEIMQKAVFLEKQYRDMFEKNSAVMILVNQADGEVLMANDAAADFYAWPREQLLGKNLSELDPDPKWKNKESFDEILRDNIRKFESTNYISSGELRDVEVKLVPYKYEGKDVFFAIIDDMTDRKKAETQMHQAQKELEQSNLNLQSTAKKAQQMAFEACKAAKAKSQFLANMSHEIRTPLTAVIGSAELANIPSCTMQEQKEHICSIEKNAKHLLSLINDILDISSLESGKLKLQQLQFDFKKFMSDIMNMMQGQAAQKGLVLNLDYLSAVPQKIILDESRFRQCLVNIIGNAIKFTDSGYVKVEVKSLAIDSGSHELLEIKVIDSGVGIEQKDIKQLFGLFMQVDVSTSRKHGGTGLGLAITRRIITMMNGSITVETEKGKGSTFCIKVTVEVPQKSESDGNEKIQIATKQENGNRGIFEDKPLSGKSILLAEDGKDNQRIISIILKKAGADIGLAENGVQAVEESAHKDYDLILMDMQMPEMDGYQATRILRQNGYNNPIIALTAHALAEDREKCTRAGCDGYISKPINIVSFIKSLSSYLNTI